MAYNVNTREMREIQLNSELEELEKVVEKVEEVVPETPKEPEQDSWKKRYSDLRSHAAKKEAEKDREVRELKEQLERATTKQIKFPKSKEEIQAWVTEYPDVAAIVETIAGYKAEEKTADINKKFAELETERKANAKERAVMDVLKVHKDFIELRDSEDFQEWVNNQPIERGPIVGQALYDALYKNETDSKSAIEAINQYKADKKLSSSPQRDKSDRKDAALDVGRSRPTPPLPTGDKPVFKESYIESLSQRDYEKMEDAIDDARREGRIVYDITAGAS